MTIVEGPAAANPRAFDDPGWAALPVQQDVDAVDLITARDGRWATRHRFSLRPAG